MKNKFLLAFLCLGLLTLYFSCQKEDELTLEQEVPNQLMSYEIIDFNSFTKAKSSNESLINKSIERLIENNLSLNRGTENNSFVIDSTQIAQITHRDGYTSYSFPVISNNQSNILQNIIISHHTNGIEVSYLAEYRTDIPISQLNTETLQYHINGSRLTKLIDPDLNFADRTGELCVDIITYSTVNQCDLVGKKEDEDHLDTCFNADGTPKTMIVSSIETVCSDSGGGSSPTNPEPDEDGFYPIDDDPFGEWGGSGSGSPSNSGNDTTNEEGQTDPCSENGTSTSFNDGNDNCIDGISTPLISEVDEIETELNRALEENPFLLLDINCNQILNWQDLAQNVASAEILNKIASLPSSTFNDFEIQSLDNANGSVVNMDYFPVNITTLPNKPGTNPAEQFTADEFLDYFRRNINTFVEGGGSTFGPYCENVTPSICQQETDLWNSDDPTGAIIYLNIPGDDGVVICSEYQNDYWYFMTMNAPHAGNHPVSGTRQFGYELNDDGSYNFFVRGVDRIDSRFTELSIGLFIQTDPILGADFLWFTFQENMNNFVNNNGGTSINLPAIRNRPNWNDVKDVLQGRKPISDLGCN